MKKKILLSTLVIIPMYTQAIPIGDSYFVGFNKSVYSSMKINQNSSHSSAGYGVYLGYQYLPLLGFAAGYQKLPSINSDGVKYDAYTLPIYFQITRPINNRFNVFADLGGIYYRMSSSDHSKNKNGASYLVDIGLSYEINKAVTVNFNYQKIGNVASIKYNNSLYIGMRYNFGLSGPQVKLKPLTPDNNSDIQSKPVLSNQDNIHMNVEITFASNSSVIDKNNMDILENFIKQLKASNIAKGKIILIGLSDNDNSLFYKRKNKITQYLLNQHINKQNIITKLQQANSTNLTMLNNSNSIEIIFNGTT